mgnify:CR=1 FL=1
MQAAILQTRPIFGDKAGNLERAQALLEKELKAPNLSAESHPHPEPDLIVLPELFATGYLFQAKEELQKAAEPAQKAEYGETTSCLIDIAKKHNCIINAGIAELGEKGKIFNSSVLVSPAGLLGVYRKVHLFGDEKKYFSPGRQPFPVFETKVGRLGLIVCFDWAFPEAIRTLALKGAQIICHPANLVLPFCQQAMITRSVENRVYILTANRVGTDEREGDTKLTFTGASQALSPGGKVLGRLGTNEEGLFVAEVDPTLADNKFINEQNDLMADRVPELYEL